jgi:anti-repressor protein
MDKFSEEISRGDIFYADLGSGIGCEQSGIRPVVVLQNDIGNKFSPTIIIATVTSNTKNFITHLIVDGPECGLKKDSAIELEQIKTIDKKRLFRKMGHILPETMEKVDEMLVNISFGIEVRDKGVEVVDKFLTIQGVRAFIDNSGTAQLNLEDVARGLGFTTVATSGNECVRWSRVEAYLTEIGFNKDNNYLPDNTFIPEPIFYLLAMKANNEVAKEFQRVVAYEILPSIRKHGMYAKDELLDNPDLLIEVATRLKEEKALRILAESKIKELTPAAEFGNAIKNNDGLILVRDYVKVLANAGIHIKQNELFAWLEGKYLYRNSHGDYIPRVEYVEQGLFKVHETPVETQFHGSFISYTTKLTGKAQEYFLNKLKEERLCLHQ